MSSATDIGSDQVRRLEELCDRFEAELKQGDTPRIEAYLERANGPLRKELLRELIALERHYVGTLVETASAADYAARFPQDSDVVESVFRTPPSEETVHLGDTMTDAPAERRLPKEFGNYVLLEVLGKGGMGVVYKARQKNPNRLVALKMIRAGGFATEEHIQRFQAETDAVARLDHRNIVPIYEAGEHDGQYYYSMALVEGPNLDDSLRDRPLESNKAARLVRTLADAVQHAHDRGIIHRDLKPANVLMSRSEAKGKVAPKITDFGLAKLTATDSGVTASGQVMGTPSYMPPEQAAGRLEEVGPASDVYSLGAILYVLLTGRPPFHAAALAETLQQVIHAEPVAPRQLNPAVDRDMETICLKCLEKTPARRYQSAAELAGDLGRYLKGQPVQARPVGSAGRLLRWSKRNPIIASLASLSVLLLIGGTGVSTYFAITASRAAASEKEAREAAEAAAKAEKRAKEDAEAKRQAADAAATRAKVAEAKSGKERKLAQWEAYKARLFPIREAWEKQEFGHLQRLLEQYKPKPGEPDFRGWEWYFFEDEVRRRFTTIKPQASRFTYVVWSPDGKLLAFRRADGAIEIRDGYKYGLLTILAGEVGSSPNHPLISWHPNSRLLAAIEGDRVKVWDIALKKAIQTIKTPKTKKAPRKYRRLVWSRDGSRLALAKAWGIEIWSWDGKAKYDKGLWSFRSEVRCLDWHPDGRRLAVGSGQVVSLIDTKNGRVIWKQNHGEADRRRHIRHVAWDSTGRRLAVAWNSSWYVNILRVFDLDGQSIFQSTSLTGLLVNLNWILNEDAVVSASNNQAIYFSGITDKSRHRILRVHESSIADFDLQPVRQLGVSVSAIGHARVWSLKPVPTCAVEMKMPSVDWGMQWSPHQPDVIASGDKYEIIICNIQKQEITQRFKAGRSDEYAQFAWHPTRPLLAIMRRVSGWVIVRDTNSGNVVFRKRCSSRSQNRHVFWSPIGKFLAAGSGSRWAQSSKASVDIWDFERGTRIAGPGKSRRISTHIAWGPKSRLLAICSESDKRLEVWNVLDSNLVWATDGVLQVRNLTWSPNGQIIAAPTNAGPVVLLDARSGKQVAALSRHNQRVLAVSWSSNGHRILTSSADGTMCIWDAATGDELLVLKPNPRISRYAFWEPGGHRIAASVGPERLLRVWGTKNLKVPGKIDRIEDGRLIRLDK